MNKKVLSMPKGYRVKVFPNGTSRLYAPRKAKVLEEDEWGMQRWVDGPDDVCVSKWWPTKNSKGQPSLTDATVRTIADYDAQAESAKNPFVKAIYRRKLALALSVGTRNLNGGEVAA
jgi:hypothetical protein